MAKIGNIIAFFFAEILALVATYLFWIPAMSFVSEMDGMFNVIGSIILMLMLIFGCVLGPIFVLTDEKLSERFK